MTDQFEGHAQGLTAPATSALTVTPSDSQDLPTMPRAIYVGGAGALRVELLDAPVGSDVTLSALQPGMVYPLRVRKVYATGTTATGLIGLW